MAMDKNKFLEVFSKALGNISVACKNFGCSREAFYDWYNNDPDFRAKADGVKEIRKDFIESALDKRIQEGDTTAIIFAAKTQCKDRGYVEKQQIEQTAPTLNIIITPEGADALKRLSDAVNDDSDKDN